MSKGLFKWTSKKSSKLVTDAVVLDKSDSSERVESSALSVSPLSPEIGFSQEFDNRSLSITRPNDLLVDPLRTPNSALSLSNTQQNVYNFSYINGLTIGNVQVNNIEQSSDRKTNSSAGGGTPRTRSIYCE